MAQYLTRSVTVTTANSWTRLSELYSTAKADITVPAGCTRISQVIMCSSTGAVDKPSAQGFKLSGNGLSEGDQEFAGFGHMAGAGTVTDGNVIAPKIKDVDIPVIAGNQIAIYFAMSGADADAGSPEVGCTLVFQ